MKQCVRCGKNKTLDQFLQRNRSKGKRHSYCKECNKQALKKHYQNNKEYYKRRNLKRKKANRVKVLTYLETHPCVMCGESDPIVLDFDHIKPETKEWTMARLIAEGHAWERLEKEIDKCQVLCANCHRRKTAKEQGWYTNVRE